MFRGLSGIYRSCYNLLLQFLYTQRVNKQLRTVVSATSCGALDRNNNPQVESIVEPFVSKNYREILAMWVWLGKKSWKRAEAMGKSIHELKAEFVYLCVREKKS